MGGESANFEARSADSAPTEVPFTETAVRRMLESEPMAETGAACLALAWQHRDALGL